MRETIGTVHEFSIAEALAGQVRRNVPAGAVIREVEIRAGPLRGLDPEALSMCWDAVTHETELAGCILRLENVPWTIRCPTCARTWSSPVPFVTCSCGERTPFPTGGDELELVALVVDEPDVAGEVAREAVSS